VVLLEQQILQHVDVLMREVCELRRRRKKKRRRRKK
jgi:hypothetical protein